MSNIKRIKSEAKEYFKGLRRLDIGKEYLKLKMGMSRLSKDKKLALMDYIKIRCLQDKKFNNFIEHLNKIHNTSVEKIKNESSNNS